MTWPPSILRLHLAGRKRTVRLWLPIVLVWPIALVLGIALAPLALLAALLLAPGGKGKSVILLGPWLFYTFCCLRGTRVQVAGPGENGDGHNAVFIAFH